MEKARRKAAIAAYRENKADAGVFALRCRTTNEVWVGATRDLRAIRNRLFFALRMGSCPHRSLQAAWAAYGSDALAFEVLETLDAEELELAFERELKNWHAEWKQRLNAERI